MLGLSPLSAFAGNESGAVTVDWVVLSAAIVALGVATTNLISAGLEDLTQDIAVQLQQDHMQNPFDVVDT